MQAHQTNDNAVPAPTVIGIDIGKDVFHVVGFDAEGKIVLRRKIKRLALAETFRKLPACTVGMEQGGACERTLLCRVFDERTAVYVV